MNLFGRMSGGTSTELMAAEFRELLRDTQVKAILFDINSPGGTVYGIPELAEEIRAARGVKPIVAVADALAASGAYWLGTQADELYVTPSGDVGSIGVVTAHTDLSAAAEKAGVKTTLVSAGRFKTEGNPYQPLGEEAYAHLKDRVDALYTTFVRDVARGRGVSDAVVREGFGQGRLVSATTARDLGMVTGIQTFDATLAKLQQLPTPRTSLPLAPRASVDTPQEPSPATGQDPRRLPEATWRDLVRFAIHG
jgi:signal peptide peptidase SppA